MDGKIGGWGTCYLNKAKKPYKQASKNKNNEFMIDYDSNLEFTKNDKLTFSLDTGTEILIPNRDIDDMMM